MSLLEEAKKITPNKRGSTRNYNEEQFEVAVAWLRGELTYKQVSSVLKITVSGGNYLYAIAAILKQFQDRIIVK